MRLSVVAGRCGSGKTTVIRECGRGKSFTFIANNPESAEMLRGIASEVDSYPFKSPCARVRQYSFRIDMHSDDPVPIIVSEPPGGCTEQSSPLLNPIYANGRDRYGIGALITVVDGTAFPMPFSKRTSEGLRTFNMVFESDAVCVTHADMMEDSMRNAVSEAIRAINDECEIVFFSPGGEGVGRMTELIFGGSEYGRPLRC